MPAKARRIRTITEMRDALTIRPGHMQHAELLYMMHELSRLISTHFDKTVSVHQLTHGQWWGLMHVFENEGVTQSELASIMQMGRPSTGKLLRRLEQKGWIERRSDPSDSRLKRVFLGDAAVPVFMVMIAEGQELFKQLLRGISPDEEQGLLGSLRKLKRNAETHALDLRRSPRKSTAAELPNMQRKALPR